LIAIDDNGKVLFTTQTLGLNPEILESEQIIERLNDRFDIIQSKKGYFIFLRCRLRYRKDEVRFVTSFSKLFYQCNCLSEEDTYAAVYATTLKAKKAIVSILGTGSNCSYFDGKEFIRKYSHTIMDDCSGNVLVKS
jgi:hypothetical protein